MMRKTLTSIALVAGCAVALAVPVAQAVDTQIQMNAPRVDPGDRTDGMAGRNNTESAQYDRLLQVNRTYRQSRIFKECGPITNAHLRASCMDSLAIDDDRRSRFWSDGLTGGSNGRINSIDRTFHGPDMYDPSFGR